MLNAYIEGAAEKGRPEIAELLQLLKDEVLRQVAGRLAPELQVLNAALRAPGRDARLDLVRRFALASPGQGGVVDVTAELEGGPGAQLPYCGREELARATAQVLEDMEGALAVVDRCAQGTMWTHGGLRFAPNAAASCGVSSSGTIPSPLPINLAPTHPRKLLARVVLLHEELAELAAADGACPPPPPPSSAEAMGAVPRAVAAFIKELVGVGSEEQRWAVGGGRWVAGGAALPSTCAMFTL